MGAGDLSFRLRFEERAAGDDGYGNARGDWVHRCTLWANVTPLRGGEQVLAGRLSGTQPVVIQVRRSEAALNIASDWRAVDVATGGIYAITSPPADMTGRRLYLDMIATMGVSA